MKLGIIGTGSISKALCTALTHKGYSVMVGGRNLDSAREIAGAMDHFASAGSIANAVHYGEVIFLAVPYKAVEEVLRNTDSYRGKIVVDCTNPVVFTEYPELAIGHTTSAAEQISKMIPEAKVIKAFNTAMAKQIENGPYFGPNDGSMFYCGDDEDAKASVHKIITATGFQPIDCGPLHSARLLEPLAVLMMRMGFSQGMGDEIAIKLLSRE